MAAALGRPGWRAGNALGLLVEADRLPGDGPAAQRSLDAELRVDLASGVSPPPRGVLQECPCPCCEILCFFLFHCVAALCCAVLCVVCCVVCVVCLVLGYCHRKK